MAENNAYVRTFPGIEHISPNLMRFLDLKDEKDKVVFSTNYNDEIVLLKTESGKAGLYKRSFLEEFTTDFYIPNIPDTEYVPLIVEDENGITFVAPCGIVGAD
jgi:hypothetical protein